MSLSVSVTKNGTIWRTAPEEDGSSISEATWEDVSLSVEAWCLTAVEEWWPTKRALEHYILVMGRGTLVTPISITNCGRSSLHATWVQVGKCQADPYAGGRPGSVDISARQRYPTARTKGSPQRLTRYFTRWV